MTHSKNLEIMANHANMTCLGRWMSEDYEPGLVSVVVPTYNRAKLLMEAMDSVLNQTYRPIELIVVDDGSADNTKEAVEKWADKYRADSQFYLKYFEQQHQGGQVARNRGLIESHGQYIKFLDSDDILKFSAIEHQVCLLSSCESKVVVFSNSYRFSERGNKIDLFKGKYPNVQMDELEKWLFDYFEPPHSILWKRKDVVSLGPWDESLTAAQDADYMFRFLFSGGQLKFCPEAWVYYRKHKDTISRVESLESVVSRLMVTEKVESILAERGLLERYSSAISYRYYGVAKIAADIYPDIADRCLRKFHALSPTKRVPGTIKHRLLVKLFGLTLKQKMSRFLHSRFQISPLRRIATIDHIDELYFGRARGAIMSAPSESPRLS